MKFENIKVEIEGRVAVLTINRPESLNAINSHLVGELDQALAELGARFPSDVRGLIITGTGEKAFAAGADIKEIAHLEEGDGRRFAERGQAVFRRIEHLPFPVIAAVNGFALGGGLELALSCDFIYCSENAKLGLPEVGLGLIPGFGGTVRLARVVGINRAREMIFTAVAHSAQECLDMGLVNKVCALDELMPLAKKAMANMLTKGPIAIKAAKESILSNLYEPADHALHMEAQHFGSLFNLTDTKEGTVAFLEKRKPEFRGE